MRATLRADDAAQLVGLEKKFGLVNEAGPTGEGGVWFKLGSRAVVTFEPVPCIRDAGVPGEVREDYDGDDDNPSVESPDTWATEDPNT